MRSYTTRFDTWHTLLASEKCAESSCIDNEGIAPYNSHVISSATRHSNTRLCGNGRRPGEIMRARPAHVYARICDISQLTSKLADMRHLPTRINQGYGAEQSTCSGNGEPLHELVAHSRAWALISALLAYSRTCTLTPGCALICRSLHAHSRARTLISNGCKRAASGSLTVEQHVVFRCSTPWEGGASP